MTVRGYPQLAEFLSFDPSIWIFRGFTALNAKNLLYMQAELVNLEQELVTLEEESSKSAAGVMAQFRVYELKNSTTDPNVRKQWEKALEVRVMLKEYNALLLQQQELLKLPKCNRTDLDTFSTWLEQNAWLSRSLHGPKALVWNREKPDLIGLSVRPEEGPEGDAFTRWFTWGFDKLAFPLLYRLHRMTHTHRPTGVTVDGVELHDTAISSTRIAEILTLILASLLPTSSIFALYYINSAVIRLTFIMLFSAVFTGCLAFFTAAKRVEIFSAAVALAAVQVVFIGTGGAAGASAAAPAAGA